MFDLPFVWVTVSEALSERVTGDLELGNLTVEETEKDEGWHSATSTTDEFPLHK